MAEGSSNAKLVLALGAALGAALLVIAFLLGRESARISPSETQAVGSWVPAVPIVEEEGKPGHARDPWKVRDEEYAYADAHREELGWIEQKPDGTVALSNARSDSEAKREPATPPSTKPKAAPASSGNPVAEYFQQVDVIRSNTGAGDPNTFAMDMIKAGMGGATSGFDQLIADTDRMTKEMEAVAPPLSCVGYHRASLESLAEARGMLESMKGAISTKDVQSLGAIAQQAAVLQAKAKALQELQDRIRASNP